MKFNVIGFYIYEVQTLFGMADMNWANLNKVWDLV